MTPSLTPLLLGSRKPFHPFLLSMSRAILEEMIPHRRARLWLRGVRLDVLGDAITVPQPIALGQVALENLLLGNLPNEPLDTFMGTMKMHNCGQYIETIMQMIRDNPAHGHRIAVFDIDRRPSAVWTCNIKYDVVPPMRTNGPTYFLVSLWDLDKPVAERAFFRTLAIQERFLLQGHRAEYAGFVPSDCFGRMMVGNAYAVPMLASVMLPMLALVAQSMADGGGPHTRGFCNDA